MTFEAKRKDDGTAESQMGRAPDEAEARTAGLSGEFLVNTALLDGLTRGNAAMVRGMQERLSQLEQAIVRVDRLLRVSQPPKPGKLGVRWWVVNGRDRMRHPTLVRWSQMKSGRWRSTRVVQIRQYDIDRSGTSSLNAGDTLKLARLAVRLIKGYESWVARLRKMEIELNKGDAELRLEIEDAHGQMRLSHRRITTNLLNAGYVVDATTMDLVADLD
jgi:hypothetical protein